MPRINPIQVSQAQEQARSLLEGVQRSLGLVPNLFKTLGQSPAALGAYLQANQALREMLTPALREQIALAVAGVNGCDYCASAHALLGVKAGIDPDQIQTHLQGDAPDEKTRAALRFARTVVEQRGWIEDADLNAVRAAGYSDGDVAEIVAVIAVNLFTNYFNHIAQTEIDFPLVETGGPQALDRAGAA